MADPYETLGLPPDADEAAVRQRYLELVRQHPPDRSPQRFAEIHEAYDELRDPVRRLGKRLFDVRSTDSLDEIIAGVQRSLQSARIPVETLLALAED